MENTATAPSIIQASTRVPYHQVETIDNGQRLRVFLPGAAKDTIELNVESSKLILTASVIDNTLPANAQIVHQEIDSGNFKISFELNDRIDVEKITAIYENGVLDINLHYIPETIKSISIA